MKAYKERDVSFIVQIFRLISTIKHIYPALILVAFIFIYDAFFWTIGPIFSEQFSSVHPLNGLFLAAYSFPTLVVGWFVGYIVKKYGSYKTAYYTFLVGSASLLGFWFLDNSPLVLFLLVLISSGLVTISLSASKGIFSKAIIERPTKDQEIEALSDIALNVGYVIGPIAAGLLADSVGNLQSFTILGVMGVIVSVYLLQLKFR